MASVFLSYNREDLQRAKSFARALENAGHSVWWDRHIKGGAQYSKAIEEELKRAEAVVVLWSKHSVQSAWVRDEAAAGRDSGRLVPVLIDGTEPPLGFRQYQSIDFARSKGWHRDPAVAELLAAVAGLGKQEAKAAPGAIRKSASLDPTKKLIVAALAATAILLGVLIWQRWNAPTGAPTVTVSASDGSAVSRALASDLLVKLGSLQSSRADALQLVEPDADEQAQFAFKIRAAAVSADPGASLSLIDNRVDTLLWSREFLQPGGNDADLRQQVAYSAAQVLRCAIDALTPGHPQVKLATLKLYLSGCADLSTTVDVRPTISLFQKVTQQAPRFPGGWGRLVIAELEAFKSTSATDRALQSQLRADIEKARKLDPQMAETYLAESWLQPARPILGWMRFADQAVAKNPSHAETLENRAIGLLHVGRMRDAVHDARRAVQAEPLSSSARQTLINALMDAGTIEAAKQELMKAERLWPGATNLLRARFRLEASYGDARQAMRMLESGQLGFAPPSAAKRFLEARIEPSSANVERAIAEARHAYRHEGAVFSLVQALAAFDRNEELLSVLILSDPSATPGVITSFFRPFFATVHRDPRFMGIAQRFGLVDYWRDSGHWPDFCYRADLPYDCKIEAAKLTT